MQCLKTIVCSYFACCGEQRGKIKVSENYSREEGVPFRQHTHTEIWWTGGGFRMVPEEKEIGEGKGRKSDGGNSDPNLLYILV